MQIVQVKEKAEKINEDSEHFICHLSLRLSVRIEVSEVNKSMKLSTRMAKFSSVALAFWMKYEKRNNIRKWNKNRNCLAKDQ